MKTAREYQQSARAESAIATGKRIVEAFLGRLGKQWYDEITLDQVAEDAGVTVQTIVRRFGGKAGLLAAVIEAMKTAAKERRSFPSGEESQLVNNLIADYEVSGDVVIRLLALEERHPILQKYLSLGRRWHRDWVSRVFADDLKRLDPRARQAALDALVIATDVYTWKLLRRDMGRSVTATRAVMKGMIRAAVADFPN